MSRFEFLYPALSAGFGAVIGAVVGGAISLWLQNKAFQKKMEQRAKNHKSMQQILGRSLFIKLATMHFTIRQICEIINKHFEHFEKNKTSGLKIEAWQYVGEVASIPDPISFSLEELSMLHKLGNNDVFHSVFLINKAYNPILREIEMYAAERQALLERMPVIEPMENAIRTNLEDPEVQKLQMQRIRLDNIAKSLHKSVNMALSSTEEALHGLTKLLSEELELEDLEFDPWTEVQRHIVR